MLSISFQDADVDNQPVIAKPHSLARPLRYQPAPSYIRELPVRHTIPAYDEKNVQDYFDLVGQLNLSELQALYHQTGIPFTIIDQKTGNTLVHTVVLNDDSDKGEDDMLTFIKYLYANRSPIDLPNKEGLTPLHIACQKQLKYIVHFLVKNGARVNAMTPNHTTPLMFACQGRIVPCELDKKIRPFSLETPSGMKSAYSDENLRIVREGLNKIFNDRVVGVLNMHILQELRSKIIRMLNKYTGQRNNIDVSLSILDKGNKISQLKNDLILETKEIITNPDSAFIKNREIYLNRYLAIRQYYASILKIISDISVNYQSKIFVDEIVRRFDEKDEKKRNEVYNVNMDETLRKIKEISLENLPIKFDFELVKGRENKVDEEAGVRSLNVISSPVELKDITQERVNLEMSNYISEQKDNDWKNMVLYRINYWDELLSDKQQCIKIHPSIINYLIQHGASLHARNSFGNLPLHYAIDSLNQTSITLLVQDKKLAFYHENLRNNAGRTPFDQFISMYRLHNDILYRSLPTTSLNEVCKKYNKELIDTILSDEKYGNNVIRYLDIVYPMTILLYNHCNANKNESIPLSEASDEIKTELIKNSLFPEFKIDSIEVKQMIIRVNDSKFNFIADTESLFNASQLRPGLNPKDHYIYCELFKIISRDIKNKFEHYDLIKQQHELINGEFKFGDRKSIDMIKPKFTTLCDEYKNKWISFIKQYDTGEQYYDNAKNKSLKIVMDIMTHVIKHIFCSSLFYMITELLIEYQRATPIPEIAVASSSSTSSTSIAVIESKSSLVIDVLTTKRNDKTLEQYTTEEIPFKLVRKYINIYENEDKKRIEGNIDIDGMFEEIKSYVIDSGRINLDAVRASPILQKMDIIIFPYFRDLITKVIPSMKKLIETYQAYIQLDYNYLSIMNILLKSL